MSRQGKKYLRSKRSGYIMRGIFTGTLSTITISTFTATFGMVIDGVLIGRFLGPVAMAAYGVAMPLYVICTAVSSIISTGAQSCCGNAMGKGDMKLANSIFNLALILNLILAIALISAVFVVGLDNVVTILGSSSTNNDMAELNGQAKAYIVGILIGLLFNFLQSTIQPFLQLDGDRERVLPTTLTMAGVNIGGDLLNVFVLGWGMFGMGLMTSVSYMAACVVLLLHFKKPSAHYVINPKLISWKETGKVLAIGLPTAVSRFCSTARSIFVNKKLIMIAGSLGVAALSVQSNASIFFGCFTLGIGMSTLLLTGIVFGEQDRPGTSVVAKCGFLYGLAINTAVGIVLIIIAPIVVGLYTSDPEVAEQAILCTRLGACCMPFNCLVVVIQNFLQGTHKVKFTLMFSILDGLILPVALVYILPEIGGLGLTGVWLGLPLAEIVMLVIYLVIAQIWNKKFIPNLLQFLLVPDSFDVPKDKRVELSASNTEDVMMASISSEALCIKNNIDEKRTKVISLCIEEMGNNIVNHGIKDPEKNHVDIKVFIKGDDIHIRLRDNCENFNPVKHYDNIDKDDPFSGIGIKMTFSMAKDVNYISTMKLNNLMIVV